jgi:hypothetical protein
MNLAIVGSRHFVDYYRFCSELQRWMDEHGSPKAIVSGGARGADAMAARFARDRKIALIEYVADWRAHGKAAGPMRNAQIVESATHMLAFPSHSGRGTQDSIRKAQKKLGAARVRVVFID